METSTIWFRKIITFLMASFIFFSAYKFVIVNAI